MNILVLKLGATGDVVRTTPLLNRLQGQFTWITAAKNLSLLQCLRDNLRCLSWEDRDSIRHSKFDIVINLEDTLEVAEFVLGLKYERVFGAFVDSKGYLTYTEDSAPWFDLSLISNYGRAAADDLKLRNRLTYQALMFKGLGLKFDDDPYVMPQTTQSELAGDIALAPTAGAVWPMKNWAYYEDLRRELEDRGLKVNVLPVRASLLEHLADVQSHRCLVSGDSLPMHFALGTGTRCVSLFTCTSPWEIHDYGIQRKIVSPLLAEFFFKRGYDKRATTAISVGEVLDAVVAQLDDDVCH